jgi:hypothetical protein
LLEREDQSFLVLLLCCVLVVAVRRKMNVNRYTLQPMYTYCVQVVAGRKKIICILPSVPGVLVPERSNVHTLYTGFLLGQISITWWQPKKIKIKCIYVLFNFYKGFLWKECAKVARFWGNHLWDCHIEIVSSRRLLKYSRILKFSYFALWPMVKIWLTPLVDDHQFLSPNKPKRKESSSIHGKDFCGEKKKRCQSQQILRKNILKLPYWDSKL